MNVEINWIAVLVSTIAGMVVGSIWYAPPVLGKAWMALVGIEREKFDKNGAKSIPVAALTTLIKAYFLATFIYLADNFYVDNSFFHNALGTSFALWLGFIFTQIAMRNTFEMKPIKLSLIIWGCELVTLLVMGAVIGAIGL